MLSYVNPLGNNNFSTTAFVSPNQLFTYDAQYYLGRKLKVVANENGRFSTIDGVPADIPQEPQDQASSMTIGVIYVPPYPTLLPSEVTTTTYNNFDKVSITNNSNRRYTMKDIDNLNKRLTSVEYYSSLSLLETATKDLTIKNSVTGLERFKNGIFVDNFNNSNGTNPNEGGVGVDPIEESLVPLVIDCSLDLKFDINGNLGNDTTSTVGGVSTISTTSVEVPFITNTNSTKLRKLSEVSYNFYNGSLITTPRYLVYADTRFDPVVTTVNNTANTTNTSSTSSNTSVSLSIKDRWEGIGSNEIVASNTATVNIPTQNVSSTGQVSLTANTANIVFPEITIKIDMFPGQDNPGPALTFQGVSGNTSVDQVINSGTVNQNNANSVTVKKASTNYDYNDKSGREHQG
jgi:hypothetical protein